MGKERKGYRDNLHVFDIDGVVTDARYLEEIIKKEFPKFRYQDLILYDVGQALLTKGYIRVIEEFKSIDFFRKYEKEICLDAPVTEGFEEYYERLRMNGNDVHFVTARPSTQKLYTEEYFVRKGIEVDSSKIHYVGSTEKEKILKGLKPGYFYEDNGETMIRMMAQKHVGSGIIVKTPYNKLDYGNYDITEIVTLKELIM